jgi:hypothetical protein
MINTNNVKMINSSPSEEIAEKAAYLRKIEKEQLNLLTDELREKSPPKLIFEIYKKLGIERGSEQIIPSWNRNILSLQKLQTISGYAFFPDYSRDNSNKCVRYKYQCVNNELQKISVDIFCAESSQRAKIEYLIPYLINSAPLEIYFPLSKIDGIGEFCLGGTKRTSISEWQPEEEREILFFRGNVVVRVRALPIRQNMESKVTGIQNLAVSIDNLLVLYNDVQNAKNEKEMVKEFKKFILKKEDFNESITKLHESCFSPSQLTYEFIGKPEILTKDDKICYVQEILLKNNIKIHADYMVLQTPEDAIKAINYLVSDTAEIAHVLYIKTKEEIGLEKYAPAYYYDRPNHHTLVFQCKNIVSRISVYTEHMKKEENEIIQISRHLAKIIVERIKKNNN